MANLPISRFLTQRLLEYDPDFEVRRGTGFERMFFRPLQLILQPIRDESETIRIGQSYRLILQQDDPDSFSEDLVDGLASNIFVFRREGGFAAGVARVFFQTAVEREYPTGGFVATGANGMSYENPAPFKITAAQMSAQVDSGLFYMDIPVRCTERGTEGEIDVNELVTVIGDSAVVRVTNLLPFEGGLDRETNTELIDRARNSIGVRDLTVFKGFNAILFENFADFLDEVYPIGFGDFEMMRDIVYNTHVGGRVDGYAKTSSVRQGSKDFIGLLIDTTRQADTITNIVLIGTNYAFIGNQNISRLNNKEPVLKQIKVSTPAIYESPVDFSGGVDLSTNQFVRLTLDGISKNIRVAGVIPAQTSLTEVINQINGAFGVNLASASNNSLILRTPSVGLNSELIISNPTVGTSALLEVFGLVVVGAPYTYTGDGPITFIEGVDYEVNDADGEVRRIEGPTIVPLQSTGETAANDTNFEDATVSIFASVQANDILRITSGADAGDYRVISKTNDNAIVVDKEFSATAGSISYTVIRSGIKSGELVHVSYSYNPLSIDIGPLVALQTSGDPQNPVVLERGIRPGRENQTITDMAFLRIVSIEEIDALTGETTGVLLDGQGGYGQGGYGQGGYGVGEGQDYFLVVNRPYERFSMYEDSYIVLRSALQGGSYRVNYEYVPEIEPLHNFALSVRERSLDGDTLMKHFLPAYVSGQIVYRVDSSDSSIPSNEVLQSEVNTFINRIKSSNDLEYSDIIQLILRRVDPFDRYGARVNYFSLTGALHNMDGSVTYLAGENSLSFPTKDPMGKRITNPVSPRICRWIADNIELIRES